MALNKKILLPLVAATFLCAGSGQASSRSSASRDYERCAETTGGHRKESLASLGESCGMTSSSIVLQRTEVPLGHLLESPTAPFYAVITQEDIKFYVEDYANGFLLGLGAISDEIREAANALKEGRPLPLELSKKFACEIAAERSRTANIAIQQRRERALITLSEIESYLFTCPEGYFPGFGSTREERQNAVDILKAGGLLSPALRDKLASEIVGQRAHTAQLEALERGRES